MPTNDHGWIKATRNLFTKPQSREFGKRFRVPGMRFVYMYSVLTQENNGYFYKGFNDDQIADALAGELGTLRPTAKLMLEKMKTDHWVDPLPEGGYKANGNSPNILSTPTAKKKAVELAHGDRKENQAKQPQAERELTVEELEKGLEYLEKSGLGSTPGAKQHREKLEQLKQRQQEEKKQ